MSADYIYAATAAKYGDPLGPTYDMLRRTKNCREIIESASRPNENLDKRLTFDGVVSGAGRAFRGIAWKAEILTGG